MSDILAVSSSGAEPPMLGAAVESNSLALVLCVSQKWAYKREQISASIN